MLIDRKRLFPFALLVATSLAAANAGAQNATFPASVAGFERVEQSKNSDAAGYAHVSEGGTISVTVSSHSAHSLSLMPMLDRQPELEQMVAGVIERASAQVRGFYPDGRVVERREALLPQEGGIRSGRMVTFEFAGTFAGRQQPMRLTIYAFCCSDSGLAYQYRFRHAASVAAGPEIAAFLRALPWQ